MNIICKKIRNKHEIQHRNPGIQSWYLKECIDSILAQTYKDFELIIVNDASPENIDSVS